MSTGFGALASGIIEEVVKDEFPKGDVLALGLLGSMGASTNPWAGMQRIFAESATLLSLTAANALVLPLADLAATPAATPFPLPVDLSSTYETTALLSAHLTSALLPLRSKRDRGQMGLSEFAGRLNWRGDTRVLGLEGSVPVWDVASAESGRWDFSAFRAEKVEEGSAVVRPFRLSPSTTGADRLASPLRARRRTTRSRRSSATRSSEASLRHRCRRCSRRCRPSWASRGRFSRRASLLRLALLPVSSLLTLPDPRSAPRLTARPPLPLAAPFPKRILGNPPLTAAPVSTSITTSTGTRHYLTHLVDNVAEFVRTRRDPRWAAMGDAFGRDEARELEEALRTLREAYVEDDEDADRDEPSGDERE